MRLKLDENMPSPVARLLRDQGHDVHTARDENLLGADDSTIWQAAQREGRTVMTMDLDFGLLAESTSGHFGVAILRPEDPRAPVIVAIAERVANIVADEHRLRFRPPVLDADDLEDSP